MSDPTFNLSVPARWVVFFFVAVVIVHYYYYFLTSHYWPDFLPAILDKVFR